MSALTLQNQIKQLEYCIKKQIIENILDNKIIKKYFLQNMI